MWQRPSPDLEAGCRMADENLQAALAETAPKPVLDGALAHAKPAAPVLMAAPQPAAKKETGAEPKDVFREIAETVVFVVVLVLLLKTFIAEAFVIPTGSMATTLWGYQKVVTCPQCKHTFPVNCSSEVDPQSEGGRIFVSGCTCPNCRLNIDFNREPGGGQPILNPEPNSGDRVLVAKFLSDAGLRQPRLHDVVVFKFPDTPQKNYVALNYIKRLIGTPGNTIAILGGKLYV